MNIPFSSVLVFFLFLPLDVGFLPSSFRPGAGHGGGCAAVACRLTMEPVRRGDERTTTA
jgi:hypothetical protein